MSFLDAVKRVTATWTINFLNLFIFILSYGTLTLHEGRFYKFIKTWANWNLYFKSKPKVFLQPTTEQEIVDHVKKATRVRVVAGGHSFNPGTVSNDLLINLDRYNNVVHFDRLGGLITVQAGIRLRDFFKIVEDAGFDLPVMGTANTQSIGGLVASDLHATGRESGYLSQQIESIRIVNGKGVVKTFTEKHDVFRAALGGIGALGVVVEVSVRLVPSFLVRRVTQYVDKVEAEDALEKLLERHEHVGFFYIGGLNAKRIRLTTYDRAQPYESKTRFVYLKNLIAQVFDLLNGGFLIDFARFIPGILSFGYWFWNSTFLGQPFISTAGSIFTSNLFFRHDEMEYGIPFSNFRKTIRELIDYLDKSGTISLLEVRFTVKNAQTKSLLGPGAGRDTTFIEILPTLTHDTRAVFASTENIFEANGGRPHLGKYTTYQQPDMRKHFGNSAVDKFLAARDQQDPEKKFVNPFVYQIFLSEAESNPALPLY